jgi:hypothetical protein
MSLKYHFDAVQRLLTSKGFPPGEPLPLIRDETLKFEIWLIESLHTGLGCAIVADDTGDSDPYKRGQERKVSLRCLLQAREYSSRVGAGVLQSDALITLQNAVESWL